MSFSSTSPPPLIPSNAPPQVARSRLESIMYEAGLFTDVQLHERLFERLITTSESFAGIGCSIIRFVEAAVPNDHSNVKYAI